MAQNASAREVDYHGHMAHHACEAPRFIQNALEGVVICQVILCQIASSATGHAEFVTRIRGTEIQHYGEQPRLHGGNSGQPC